MYSSTLILKTLYTYILTKLNFSYTLTFTHILKKTIITHILMKMNYSSTFVFTLLLKTIKYTSILAKLNFSCTLVYTLILKFTKSIRNTAILFILFIISLYSYTQNTLCTLILRKLYFFNTLIFTFILTVAGVQQSLYSSTLVLTIKSRLYFVLFVYLVFSV